MKNNYRIEEGKVYIELNSPKYGRMEAIIDIEDFEKVNAYSGVWYANFYKKINDFYITINVWYEGKKTKHLLHRVILNITNPKLQADHINHNTFNNTRVNLRIVTSTENNQNKGKRKDNTSGFKGIRWKKHTKKWEARISNSGKQIHIGYFNTAEAAHAAYVEKKLELHSHATQYSLNGDVSLLN